MSQEQSATRQLSDVQNLAREEQPLAEDRRQNVGVFAGAHRAQKNNFRVGIRLIGERSSCPFEHIVRRVGPVRAQRKALQVLRRDPRVR
jgi:hypothetical protein